MPPILTGAAATGPHGPPRRSSPRPAPLGPPLQDGDAHGRDARRTGAPPLSAETGRRTGPPAVGWQHGPMGRFLVVTWAGGGNVAPMLVLARELARRGHTVDAVAPESLRRRVEAAGAALVGSPDGWLAVAMWG